MERIRQQCRWVAEQARHVAIREELIEPYAAALATPAPDHRADPAIATERQRRATFWLTLDAINFGSGWFPTLRKAPGRSGYFTIHDGLRRRFKSHGPWPVVELQEITAVDLAEALDQDPAHELMDLFARSLRDLAEHLIEDHDGDFAGPVDAAAGSAVALMETLGSWGCFADSSAYRGRDIPFLKRAQIAAADLSRAGVVRFGDLPRLTMFADNLVPHVLRLDGILTFQPELVVRIEREELIEHGSPEEVEIRACALHAVELIVAASPQPTMAAEIDQLLWQRGQEGRYKASPRHRSRCTAY